MKNKIEELLNEIETFAAESSESVEEFRIKILSKKGKVTELFAEFKSVAPEMRKEVGGREGDEGEGKGRGGGVAEACLQWGRGWWRGGAEGGGRKG